MVNKHNYWLGKKHPIKIRRQETIICKQCGKSFNAHIGDHRKFCSEKCFYNSRHNIIREKSSNWKGGKPKCIDCGKQLVAYNATRCVKCVGKQRVGDNNPSKRPEVRKKLGGINCHFYKGGKMSEYSELEQIRKSNEYLLWHKICLERDWFTCQKCNKHGGELRVHHKNNFKEFPELRLAIDNGITLCKECHKQFHKKYGYQNNTEEQLIEFLNN